MTSRLTLVVDYELGSEEERTFLEGVTRQQFGMWNPGVGRLVRADLEHIGPPHLGPINLRRPSSHPDL